LTEHVEHHIQTLNSLNSLNSLNGIFLDGIKVRKTYSALVASTCTPTTSRPLPNSFLLVSMMATMITCLFGGWCCYQTTFKGSGKNQMYSILLFQSNRRQSVRNNISVRHSTLTTYICVQHVQEGSGTTRMCNTLANLVVKVGSVPAQIVSTNPLFKV